MPIFKYKTSQSVLAVIYPLMLEVLLSKREEASEFWKSVTGSKNAWHESFVEKAVCEVQCLSCPQAAVACFSSSNVNVILLLPSLAKVKDSL